MAKKSQNEVLPAEVRGNLKVLLNLLAEINNLNATNEKESAKNLTDTKITKVALRRLRTNLMTICKLCKASRGAALKLRKSIDSAKK